MQDILTGRREKEGTEVVAEIKKRGGTASFFKADFAEDSDVRAAVDFVLTTYGRLRGMQRRGSDAGGVWIDRHVGLGHRRFVVIDLAGGVQPKTRWNAGYAPFY
jgi:asparagine synthetase B (glutamine-hydrolysing)